MLTLKQSFISKVVLLIPLGQMVNKSALADYMFVKCQSSYDKTQHEDSKLNKFSLHES